jgi:glycosyltransferase involved in cell wall biosynthesis
MLASPFQNKKTEEDDQDFKNAKVVFVSDLHRSDYAGGAELSTDALTKTSPFGEVCFLRSRELNKNHISEGTQKIWVFFNFSGMDLNLVPMIVANCHYFVVEYDYKFCRFRSIEKHRQETGEECDCHTQRFGMFMSSFFAGAEHVFYMSEAQRKIHVDRFSFLGGQKSSVLSSIFELEDIELIERIRSSRTDIKDKFAILGSNSWIKGVEETKRYLEDRQIDFDVLQGLPYHDMLTELSRYKGLCFRPLGGDTCPRLVIEAKLLGLELDINENVQHASEDWFSSDVDQVSSYILDGHNRFWGKVMDFVEKPPTVSGYTTVRNVESQGYPWRKSIKSLLQFCDEVIVVDAGSDDGSFEELQEWSKEDERIKLHQKNLDTQDERFAVKVDGLLKAHARSLCQSDWCWQQDIDEVVHESDAPKIKSLAANLPKALHLLALPVIEYWGDKGKVRVDVNPWKWRLSRNLSHITHGVPKELRMYDENGEMYAAQGTDSCDYIDDETGERIPFSSFYTQDVHNARIAALSGSEDHLKAYESWFNSVVDQIPGVHHYSWYNLEQKITNYKNYWSRFWQSMYGKTQEDTAENNMFFNKPWSEVSDDDIQQLALDLESKMGGWIFHQKVNFNQPTPSMKVQVSEPDESKFIGGLKDEQ